MVGSSPTVVHSAFFGALDLDQAATLFFPQGLPGFENEHRFAALQIPDQYPLVYLQSVSTPTLCLLTLPAQVVDRNYRVHVQPEDCDALQLPSPEDPVLALVIVAAEESSVPTANLAAPLIVNLANRFAVQSLQPLPGLSYRHPLAAASLC